jgi:S1-C subfamily serine protease
VSLGTIPDFAFSGPGVRLEGVVTGSPAEAAGLRAGDTILAVNEVDVADLRGYSQVLKALEPGQKVAVRFRRDGAEQSLTLTAAPR